MGHLRNHRTRLRRLERSGDLVLIPQPDGSIAKFPPGAMAEAFLHQIERLKAWPDAPPPHPLVVAATNSSDPWWRNSLIYADPIVIGDDPVVDMSEQAVGQDEAKAP